MGNTIRAFLILIAFLLFTPFTHAKNIRADGSDSLNFQTNGKNTRAHIDSAGAFFFDLMTQDRVPYFGASGELIESNLLTFDGSDLIFPILDGKFLVGSGANQKSEVTISGDATITNTGDLQLGAGVILDADVNASANITATKLGTGAVDNTELNLLDGVTLPLATTTGTQDISGKTFTDAITLTEIASPGAAPAGEKFFNCKSDDKCYFTNDAGTEVEISTGSHTAVSGAESLHTVSANYTVTDIDGYTTIVVDDTTSDRTITLPTVSDNTDRIIRIKNDSTQKNKVIIDAEGGQFIEGMLTLDLDYKASYAELQSDGTEWKIVSTSIGSYLKNYTITASGTNFVNADTVVRPYRDIDGNWFATFNLRGTATGGGIQNGFITLPGLTFNNNGQQALTYSTSGSSGSVAEYAESNSGASTIVVQSSSVTFTLIVSGNVELLSKPTFVE